MHLLGSARGSCMGIYKVCAMRYALRNKEKIEKAYGKQYVEQLTASLAKYFDVYSSEEVLAAVKTDFPYPVLRVGQYDFFITKQVFDVLHLALKAD